MKDVGAPEGVDNHGRVLASATAIRDAIQALRTLGVAPTYEFTHIPAVVASVPAGSPPVAEAPSTEPSPAAEAGISSAAVHLLFRLVKRFNDRGRQLVRPAESQRPRWGLADRRTNGADDHNFIHGFGWISTCFDEPE